MKIEQLKQMIEIGKTHSINKASANLFISQPSLSTSIQSLEDELKCQLIVRTNKGVILTSKGENFIENAESIVEQVERLKAQCQPYGDEESQCLSIGNMRFRFVTDAACNLYNKYKSMPFNLQISESDRDGVINMVSKGDCEIGIINILGCYKKDVLKQIKVKNVQYYRLTVSPATIVVGYHNPLFSLPDEVSKISTAMLKDFPQVRYQEMDYGHYSDKGQRLGIPKKRGEILANSRAAMFEILERTDAYMIASTNRSAYKHSRYYNNARSFDIEDKTLECEFGWLKRIGNTPSDLAMEYIQVLSEYFG